MGGGYWTRNSFIAYSHSRGRSVDADGHLDKSLTDGQIFTRNHMDPKLDPKDVVRECCDSEEHPATIPVILALDVTGSMGAASAEVAKKMNEVMTSLYDRIKDVEFMVMGIGDLAYDSAPIQISQFESDIRIAEQLDLVYMEHGGGGNLYESYTAAWYMGLYHTRLDCMKRGKKGLIITMGDESLNPYLPKGPLASVTGDILHGDVETPSLYREAVKKFELYHIHVCHRQPDRYLERMRDSFGKLLPEGHVKEATVEEISDTIVKIVTDFAEGNSPSGQEISWETGDQPEKKKFWKLISW